MHNDKEFNAIVWHTRVLQLEILFFVLSLFPMENNCWFLSRGNLCACWRQDKIAKITFSCTKRKKKKNIGTPKISALKFCDSVKAFSGFLRWAVHRYITLAMELQHLAVTRALLTSSCNFCHHVSLDLTHRRLSILDWYVGKTQWRVSWPFAAALVIN